MSVEAEGDRVMVAIVREYPDPSRSGQDLHVDVVRYVANQDGKADEHWDGATIAALPRRRLPAKSCS